MDTHNTHETLSSAHGQGEKEVSGAGVTSASLPTPILPQTLTPASGVADSASATESPEVGIRWDDISPTVSLGLDGSGELCWCIKPCLLGGFSLWGYRSEKSNWGRFLYSFSSVSAAKQHAESRGVPSPSKFTVLGRKTDESIFQDESYEDDFWDARKLAQSLYRDCDWAQVRILNNETGCIVWERGRATR